MTEKPETLPMPIPAPLTPAQRTRVLNLVRRAAKAEIMPRFRSLAAHDIGQKTGPQDLVTEADRAAEAMIARGLLAMFPNALIVGEEDASENPEIVARIAEAEMAFTIDPVDGTWNYAHGLTLFGVIVAATRFGVPVFGLLYDPVMDDAIVAVEDGPAQMLQPRRSPRPLRASKGGEIAALSGYASLYTLPEDKRAAMAQTLPRFQRALNLRCSCHEFRMLAQGHVDFVLSSGLTPWDHAAGALIAQRAGCHVAMLDGSDYRADTREGVLLAASNEATWTALRDLWEFLL